uniref:Uncharacterized protein n=1 Tax=Panagrolaimus sp. JU765 TaxID=591449 RepID=A0AC34RNR8_9BILA
MMATLACIFVQSCTQTRKRQISFEPMKDWIGNIQFNERWCKSCEWPRQQQFLQNHQSLSERKHRTYDGSPPQKLIPLPANGRRQCGSTSAVTESLQGDQSPTTVNSHPSQYRLQKRCQAFVSPLGNEVYL